MAGRPGHVALEDTGNPPSLGGGWVLVVADVFDLVAGLEAVSGGHCGSFFRAGLFAGSGPDVPPGLDRKIIPRRCDKSPPDLAQRLLVGRPGRAAHSEQAPSG